MATPPSTPPRIHIFKAGTHVSVHGGSFAFSEAQVAGIAAIYNPALHKAPVVLGHPALDAPAYGWASKMEAEGPNLYYTETKTEPAFAEMRSAGRFEQRSLALYAPGDVGNPAPGHWYPRHIGYLGATPPAVKGLEQYAFADGGAALVAFCVPNDDLTDGGQQAAAFSETSLHKELLMTEAELAILKAKAERADAAEAQVAALTAAARVAAASARYAGAVAFAEGHVVRGVLKPEHKDGVVALLCAEPAVVAFAEAGGKQVQTDAGAIVRGLLEAAVPPVAFGEHVHGKPPAAKAGSDAELHAKADALAKTRGIGYEEALRQLC